MSRLLVVIGVVCIAVGIAWPWLTRIGLGRLPGDIRVEREGFGFFFPITTCIVISLVISLVVWLFRK